jgi:uncharacterized membrane protein YgcG
MIDIRTLVSSGLRRYPDPDVSADPLIRTIVGQLRALPTPAPSPGFREELRAQLIAVTPRLVAEGVTGGRPARAARKPHRATAPRVPIRRPAAVMGTLVLLFVLLLAGGVWMSSHTLPGDSLYGLKRASENVQLSLTGGDGARGRQYLALAKKRANEVSGLLGRTSSMAAGSGPQASGNINAHAAKLIADTLRDADADTRNGVRLLTGQAVRNMSNGPLSAVTTWAPAQLARLDSIVNRAPPGATRERAVTSRHLVQHALTRANQLGHDMGCICLANTANDELGPLPCDTACNPVTPVSPGQQPGSTKPSTSPSTSPTGTEPATPNKSSGGLNGLSGSTSAPGAGSGTGGASSSGSPGGSVLLPLPSVTPTGPVTVDTCGVHVTLGPLGLGLGPCGLDLSL